MCDRWMLLGAHGEHAYEQPHTHTQTQAYVEWVCVRWERNCGVASKRRPTANAMKTKHTKKIIRKQNREERRSSEAHNRKIETTKENKKSIPSVPSAEQRSCTHENNKVQKMKSVCFDKATEWDIKIISFSRVQIFVGVKHLPELLN